MEFDYKRNQLLFFLLRNVCTLCVRCVICRGLGSFITLTLSYSLSPIVYSALIYYWRDVVTEAKASIHLTLGAKTLILCRLKCEQSSICERHTVSRESFFRAGG